MHLDFGLTRFCVYKYEARNPNVGFRIWVAGAGPPYFIQSIFALTRPFLNNARMRILLILACCPMLVFAGETGLGSRAPVAPPVVKTPLLFNTAEADAVLAAMQIMPLDNPWNEDISNRPLLLNSDAMIARITADLAPNRRTLRLFSEMNFVLVPDNQLLAPIKFVNYPDESDLNGGKSPVALYPIPPDLPIETWPVGTGSLTLQQWQQDTANKGGDRHAIIVQPGKGVFWE
ncbi:MAG: hypothetical protein WCS01_17105, partial [bacterium]